MKQILLILAIISSGFSYSLRSFAQDSQTFPIVEFTNMKRGKQSEIIDVVGPLTLLSKDGTIVHLSGVDVPGSYGGDISPLAVTARDVMKDMLVGKRVQFYHTKDKNVGIVNRMGHSLVHIERMNDDAWAQGTLIALGLARVKTTGTNAHMAKEMLKLEADARAQKLGMWADDSVLSADEAGDAIGTFAIVEGRIESVALKKNRIYINFGKNWKTDFTASIAPADKRRFSKAKLDPLGWGGRKIRVRGSIREYNGPYMDITHPQVVEFIDE